MSLFDKFKKKKPHVFTDEERELSSLTRQLKQQNKMMQQRIAIQESKNLLTGLKADFEEDSGDPSPMGGFEGMIQSLIMQKMTTSGSSTTPQQVTTTEGVLSSEQVEKVGKLILSKISKKEKDVLREQLSQIPEADLIRILNFIKANI